MTSMDHPETRPGMQLGVVKHSYWLPVSHEALADYADHVCDDCCPPGWTPPPVPWHRRVRYTVRSLRWRLRRIPGYRLVHKDDLPN